MKGLRFAAVAATLALAACGTRASQSLGPAPQAPSPSVSGPGPTASAPAAKATKTPAKAPAKAPAKQPTGSTVSHTSKSCGSLTGGAEGSVAQLVDVRVGAHEDYDRVTFEFAAPSDGRHFGLPRYVIKSAVPPITEDGSGATVDLDGASFFTVVLQGASGVELDGDGYTLTYTGPKDFRPGYQALAEARQTGDFEAVLSWAFGLDQGTCPTVMVLQDPLRLAVDFPH